MADKSKKRIDWSKALPLTKAPRGRAFCVLCNEEIVPGETYYKSNWGRDRPACAECVYDWAVEHRKEIET